MGFTADDRKQLQAVFTKIDAVSDSMGTYQTVLKKVVGIIDKQARHICALNSYVNVTNYRLDAQNQYNRRESLRALNLNPAINGSDAVKIMMDIAAKIPLEDCIVDLQVKTQIIISPTLSSYFWPFFHNCTAVH